MKVKNRTIRSLIWLVLTASGCGRMMPVYAQTTPLVVPVSMTCATSVDGTVVGTPNPLTPPVVAAVFSGTLPSGNYFTQIAWYDAAGHLTLVGPEVQTQLSGTGGLTVNLPVNGKPATALGMNVYIGASSGTETLQGQTTGSATFPQSTPLASGAAEPSTNTTLCQPVANDAGWPTGTGYNVSMTTPAGSTMPGYPMQWQLLGPGGTINLGQGIPYYNGTVQYPIGILSRPYNHAPQSISGPLSMTGYAVTQVQKLGVGTSVPAWGVDVEGPGLGALINSLGGLLVNGLGGTAGQCLASGSSTYNGATAFNTTVNCITSLPTVYYQTLKLNNVAATQVAAANFSQRFTFANASGQTNIDLNTPGTTNLVATYTSNPSTSTNCAQFDGSGNIEPSSSTSCALSVSQTDVTGSRAFGSVYTNGVTPILVEAALSTLSSSACTGTDTYMTFSVGPTSGSMITEKSNGIWNNCQGTASTTFMVPANYSYEVNYVVLSGGPPTSFVVDKWLELPY